MAGSLSDYAEVEMLDHIMGVESFTMPTTYIALCTADPTDAGTGANMSEVTNANAYARLALSADFQTGAAAGAIANDGAIEFVTATGSWGTVTHFAILDSGTHGEGNMIAHGDLTASKTVGDGDTPSFAIGELDITIA